MDGRGKESLTLALDHHFQLVHADRTIFVGVDFLEALPQMTCVASREVIKLKLKLI